MIYTIIKSILKKDFHSFEKSTPNFETLVKNVETTSIALLNKLDTNDLVDGRSAVGEYQFIADTNLMKCYCSSAVIMSDKFSKRLSLDSFVIAKPDALFHQLSKDNVILSDDGEVLSAKDWNNFWKDVIAWAKESKPLSFIEKKPILFHDLMGIYDGDDLISFEQGIIPFEQIIILNLELDGAKKLSPITIDTSYDVDVESWLTVGLK